MLDANPRGRIRSCETLHHNGVKFGKEKYVVFLRHDRKFFATSRVQISALLNAGVPGDWEPNPRFPKMQVYAVLVDESVICILNATSDKNIYVLR